MIHADLTLLVHATNEAFESALSALLHRDSSVAREVLHGASVRRDLVSASRESARANDHTSPYTRAEQLELVGDLARIGELAEFVSRRVLEGGEPSTLTPAGRLEVSVILDAGGSRLRGLADDLGGPGPDPAYAAGSGRRFDSSHPSSVVALFDVIDRASRDRSVTMRLCAAMAVTVLTASRHAARAA